MRSGCRGQFAEFLGGAKLFSSALMGIHQFFLEFSNPFFTERERREKRQKKKWQKTFLIALRKIKKEKGTLKVAATDILKSAYGLQIPPRARLSRRSQAASEVKYYFLCCGKIILGFCSDM